MFLFLDDIRDLEDIELPDGEWVIARDFSQAVDIVLKTGFPNFISFDHDLGDGPTGYDFAKWLVERDLDIGDMPSDFSFNVHSANPVGAANIKYYLDSYLNLRSWQC